jgi:putative Mg2+ transporter-C (MgtC) family protein
MAMELELWILLRLGIAALLGGLIGFERGRAGKAAGLRTHSLIAMGAALFVSFSVLFTIASQPLIPPGEPGNFRIQIEPLATVEALVTGISFLGAGLVFVAETQARERVKNLTTAATILVTAGVGVAVGLERYVLAVGCTLLVLAILWLVPQIVPSNE